MKFGVRECTNIVFRAKTDTMVGNTYFKKGQPVLYIDSAKTSTLEGAATTVYAQGGRGNARLIAWEGEKTLTFTVEDALLSPLGFSILSGAGLIDNEQGQQVHVHRIVQQIVEAGSSTSNVTFTYYQWNGTGYTELANDAAIIATDAFDAFSLTSMNSQDDDLAAFKNRIPSATAADAAGSVHKGDFIKVGATTGDSNKTYKLDLTDALESDEAVCPTAPIFIMNVEADGSLKNMIETEAPEIADDKIILFNGKADTAYADGSLITKAVAIDFYVTKNLYADGEHGQAYELQIDAENFAGYFYVEADTLFRRQDNGVDMPAIITLPNVKIQSNFTFTMASSGDPSTFTFTMDAMPGYTYFDPTKKVLCVIQIIDASKKEKKFKTVMPHNDNETQQSFTDYVANNEDSYVGS